MSKDLVSVIIAVYNDIRFLAESIESVYAQSVADFEILLIDDCSDNSDEIKRLAASYSVKLKYFRNSKNIGLSASRNFGIRNSIGEYLCFLDADDYFAQDKLRVQRSILRDSGDLWMVFSDEFLVREGKVVGRTDLLVTHQLPASSEGILHLYAQKSFIAVFSVMIRRSVIDKIGFFEEKLRAWEDDDFWFRVMLKGKVKFSNYPSGYRRLHDSNMSSDRHAMNYFAIRAFNRWVKLCDVEGNYYVKELVKKRAMSFFKVYVANGLRTLNLRLEVFRLMLSTWMS